MITHSCFDPYEVIIVFNDIKAMFCFENAFFETCKPILVVYFVFVFCVILITIVLLRCVCSPCKNSQSSDENKITIDIASPAHGVNIKDKNAFLKRKDRIEDTKIGRDKKIALDIELQQMEIYQMAEYNQIRPSYI